MTARHPLLRFSGVLVALALLATACSGASLVDDESSTSSETTAEPSVLGTTTSAPDPTTTDAPPDLTGSLRVTGSSTVEGVTNSVAAGYAERQPDVTIEVTAEGTGSGFDDLCTDAGVSVVGASRAISGTESAQCLANGVLPIELRLARDGIAVIAHNSSDLQCLTYTDLYALAGPESTGLSSRADVAQFASQLSSTTSWGNGDIRLLAPGPDSGTHELFLEFVLEPIAASRGVGAFMRVDHRSLDSNAQLVDAVASDPGAMAFVGSSYAVRNSDKVKLIGVSDGSGCVLPNDAAVTGGLYPMARDLYLYADAASEDPILDDFLFYYLEVALAQAVSDAQYVGLSAIERAETVARWVNR